MRKEEKLEYGDRVKVNNKGHALNVLLDKGEYVYVGVFGDKVKKKYLTKINSPKNIIKLKG